MSGIRVVVDEVTEPAVDAAMTVPEVASDIQTEMGAVGSDLANPADDIGAAAEAVEIEAAEVAEAAVNTGHPELADEVFERVMDRLAAAGVQIQQAAEEVAVVAEEVAEEAGDDEQFAEAAMASEAESVATEAAATAGAAAEEAQAIADDVPPAETHWWYRPRKLGRISF